MSLALKRISAIESEMYIALDELCEIIEFFDKGSPSPKMKVRVLNSMLVSMVSILEEGFRSQLSEYIKILEDYIVDYKNLPKAIKEKNLECVIGEIKKSKKESAEIGLLIPRLKGFTNNSTEYELYIDAMVLNKNGLKSQEITDLVKAVGIEKFWSKLSSSDILKEYTAEERSDAIVGKVTAEWNSIFVERDTIVHRTSQARGWGKDKLMETVVFIKIIVNLMTKHFAKCADDYVRDQPIV